MLRGFSSALSSHKPTFGREASIFLVADDFRSSLRTLLGIWRCAPQAQFREAVTRMESLMEQEAKDSVSAINNLRDKAMLAKDRQAPCHPAS